MLRFVLSIKIKQNQHIIETNNNQWFNYNIYIYIYIYIYKCLDLF